MKRCDLHNHSVYSDGSFTPGELIEYAKKKGISAIALTDHNTVGGLKELDEASKKEGVEYIFGSELTTDFRGKEVHLLVLFITEENEHRIKDFTDIQRKRKEISNIDLEKNLVTAGYNISLADLKKRYSENINRAHIAKELVLLGECKTTDEAFEKFLKSGGGFYNPPERVQLFEGIELALSWGCVPVIAHPLLSVTKEELEELLPEACARGLCGMEVYYPKFNEEQREYLLKLTEKYSIIASGGSDFHGTMKTAVDMDDARVPYECYEKLVAKHKEINSK